MRVATSARASAHLVPVVLVVMLTAAISTAGASPAAAQVPTIIDVVVEQDGVTLTDPALLSLIETTAGEPLSTVERTESIRHLDALNRFEQILVLEEDTPGGIRLIYRLIPRRPIVRVEFRGQLGLDDNELRRLLRERYGDAPSENRVDEAVQLLRTRYRDKGYPDAVIEPRIEQQAGALRSTLFFDITAGTRGLVREVRWAGEDETRPGTFIGRPDIRTGEPYDRARVDERLQKYVESMRRDGFYEARAEAVPEFTADGVLLHVTVERGPRVRVVFTGDTLSRSEQQRLVPVRTEASIDEDLLENATLDIEEYLRVRGYRDATAPRTRAEENGELTITFDIRRGPRYMISGIAIEGEQSIPEEELREVLQFEVKDPFVEAIVEGSVYRISQQYQDRGFNSVRVEPKYAEIVPESPSEPRRVQVTIAIDEGAQARVGSIGFSGNTAFSEAELLSLIGMAVGDPLSPRRTVAATTSIESRYRDLGFKAVRVEPLLSVSGERGETGDLLFDINEGRQTFIDRVIIDGNERTSRDIIERELLLGAGDPLGATARAESEARLKDLGLFRRVRIEERPHSGDERVDLIVRVEEALRTTLGYGGGLEISSRLRPVAAEGVAEERIELVPRGFLEVSRHNIWGKNRSISGFARVSARSRDEVVGPGDVDTSYGINEYRVFGTFREPRVGGSPAEALVTAIAERAIRTSYSFVTREARAEIAGRLSDIYTSALRFSVKQDELFDVDPTLTEEEKPLIDRLFPQVRLSKFSGSLTRNTRNDELDPSRGTFFSTDVDVAARALGSEVGFLKTRMQLSWYHQLPFERRTVLAMRGLVGLARGFRREAPVLDEQGAPVVGDDGVVRTQTIQDLPASERFFSGGSTTHRGFSVDRLASPGTLTRGGFPIGGNGEVLLNTEVRVSIFEALAGVGFLDLGNVFDRAADIRAGDLRPGFGGGLHYRSFVGPVRVELGVNPDRREIVAGRRERGYVLHISFGPAF